MHLHRYALVQQLADGGLDVQGIPPEAIHYVDVQGVALADVLEQLGEAWAIRCGYCAAYAVVGELLIERPAEGAALRFKRLVPGGDPQVSARPALISSRLLTGSNFAWSVWTNTSFSCFEPRFMSFSRKWWPVWAIAAAIVIMVSTQLWLDWVFAGLPVEAPVDLSIASTVATKVHLRSPERYDVSLRVYSNGRSFDDVAGILGESGQYPMVNGGVPVRARISLTELGYRRVVFDKEVVSRNRTGAERGMMVWRRLAWVDLTPGDYELKVEIPEPVSGLSGFRAAIAFDVSSFDNRAFGIAVLVWLLSAAVIFISLVGLLLRTLTLAAARAVESAKPSSKQPRWHVLWAGLIVLGIGVWGQLRDPLFDAPENLESNVPITIVMSCLAFYLIWIALKRPRVDHDRRGGTAGTSDANR